MKRTETHPKRDEKVLKGWLTGWRSIAQYLDVSPETARRWHKEENLWIMRSPSGRPMVKPEMLDEWLSGRRGKPKGGKH